MREGGAPALAGEVKNKMKILGRQIGYGVSPYIIAEASCSHCGNLQKAFRLIEVAKNVGADCIKFQAYDPDILTLDCNKSDFLIKGGLWKGRKLHELYQKAKTPFEWFPALFSRAHELDIAAISSVFHHSAVDILEKIGCPAYKIASMEINDLPLIRYAAKSGKPIIISTGMAVWDEIADAYEAAQADIRRPLAFLHCVSGYPTDYSEANLYKIPKMGWAFHGISDHTPGIEVPIAATALGSMILEKHLCLSRSDPTEDAEFSLEPHEFKDMCKAVRSVWKAMQPSEAKSEESSRQLRRSLYVTASMRKGEVFTDANVRSIRPSYGLPPKELPNVLGKRASQDIEYGTALTWDLIAS